MINRIVILMLMGVAVIVLLAAIINQLALSALLTTVLHLVIPSRTTLRFWWDHIGLSRTVSTALLLSLILISVTIGAVCLDICF